MNIIFKAGNHQKRLLTGNITKTKNAFVSSPKTDVDFENIFNEQVWLSNAFKQNITYAIGNMDFAYPSDGENIKKMVDQYFQSSLQLLKNKLINAQALANKSEADNFIISIKEVEKEPLPEKWTEVWIEQTDDNFVVALHCKPENEKHNSSWIGEWISQIEPVLVLS